MSRHNGPNIVTNGLVLYLDAANRQSYPGSGTDWHDVSENGNNGTLTNGPTFSSANGGSIVFDGVNDYVQGNFVALSSYTISCWFTRNGIQSEIFPTLIAFGQYSPAFYLEFNNNNTVSYYNSGLPGVPLTFFSLDDIPLNTWVNLVFTKSGTTISSYLNSTFKASITDNRTTATNFVLNGDRGDAPPNWTTQWGGSIASTQIYNRALSAEEITQNYNATKARYGL